MSRRSRLVREWGVAALIITLLAIAGVGLLAAPPPTAADRAYTLEQRLRCPVCKSVSIAESPSSAAADMRRIVTEQLAAGRSDEQVIAYFTDRYGEWILLDPPAQGETLLLWLLPSAAVVVAVLVLATRSRRPSMDSTELPAADRSGVDAAVREYRTRLEEDEP